MRIAALLLTFLLALPAWAAELSPVEYVRTIDGDTIVVVEDGEELHVRLLGIDAPELSDGLSQAFGAAFVLAFVLERSGMVWLERKPGEELDKYDRTLAWVWVRTGAGAEELNSALVRGGWAVEAYGGIRDPGPRLSISYTPEQMRAALGGVPGTAAADIPLIGYFTSSGGGTVYVTATGSRYHRAGWRYLSASSTSISLADARAQGYAPCSVCNP